jgi:lysozyme family protein
MTDDIDEIINTIIKNEGGYVNHPNDRGGPTNYGITITTLSAWRGRTVSINDVKNLDIDEAKEIYIEKYYKKTKINIMPSEIQKHLTDISALNGPSRVWMFLSRALNKLGASLDESKVFTDDIYNEYNTIVNNVGFVELNNALVDVRIEAFNNIVKKNPSQKVFIRGWLNRANKFRILS